jgi:Immunity protein Imm1
MTDLRYREVWVDASDGQALCALINGDVGWLMYLRRKGDPGFSSRNPEYAGPGNATIDYILSNGQRDEYPASWALPILEVERALEYFRDHNRPAPFVTWHNDSEDGASIPSAQ